MDKYKQTLLRQLPGVDRIIEAGNAERQFDGIPKSVLVPAIRAELDGLRATILRSDDAVDESRLSFAAIVAAVAANARQALSLNLKRTVNATGVRPTVQSFWRSAATK